MHDHDHYWRQQGTRGRARSWADPRREGGLLLLGPFWIVLALRFLAVDGCPISVSRRVLSVDVGLAPVTTSGSTVGTGNRGVTRLESHLSVLGLTISLVRGLITPEGTGITLDGFRVSLDGAPLPILWTHREGVPSSSRPQSLID